MAKKKEKTDKLAKHRELIDWVRKLSKLTDKEIYDDGEKRLKKYEKEKAKIIKEHNDDKKARQKEYETKKAELERKGKSLVRWGLFWDSLIVVVVFLVGYTLGG